MSEGPPQAGGPPRRIAVSDIQWAVVEEYGLRPLALTGRGRARDLAWPRQLAMFLARKLTCLSTPVIGRRFNRDQSTVLHACKTVPPRLEADPELAVEVAAIRKRVEERRRAEVVPFPRLDPARAHELAGRATATLAAARTRAGAVERDVPT